jgi:type I restriction enzyme, R subunit
MPNFISEDAIEKAAIRKLTENHGYRTVNCLTTDLEDLNDKSNRADKQEVVLRDILEARARALNPRIPAETIGQAIEQLTSSRSAMSPILANKTVYGLIRDGIPVEFDDAQGRKEEDTVQLIDFEHPDANDFCAVIQLWIKGERYPRRPDILIYVNGLPLVFIELKNSNIKVQNAYDDNLTNYKKDIPLLFQYNAFCILSNALETKVGSSTAGYEYFFNWLRPDDEKEKIDRKQMADSTISLERVIDGLLAKDRLLDYLQNYILYYKENAKIIAQNHQFLGVNKAVAAFEKRDELKGRLGVFWHTQGSGKSFSMIFLARKVFHNYKGNYTFVIITDRDDLDRQIYLNFLDTETVKKAEAAQPRNGEQMREFLGTNKRLVFTLIQKFRYDKGKDYPVLSERKDIIVIVDEAHRTQYAALAENMRKGLPNAQFFAFTGTPLLGKERKTNAWFGDYVSEYNFVQSVDDGATVPLYYQKRRPEVLIQNENLGEDFYRILDEAGLDDKAQEKLENEFGKEIEVIKRDDRLEIIAKDIVAHFPARGYLGKGMVVSVDKFTSVKMFDKVQKHWKEAIKRLVGEIGKTKDPMKKAQLQQTLAYMQAVEMGVVISEEAGEEERFEKQGLDIKPHRKKMAAIDANGHDLEFRFKDPKDGMQLVFVCAMWLTGFDAPTVSTLYLDKPMQGHTLMQTIARANRVTAHLVRGVSKRNGEVVDYYNVFVNMKKAMADYALGDAKGKEQEEPIKDKSCLFLLLDDALAEGVRFCETQNIPLKDLLAKGETFSKVGLFKAFADKLLSQDRTWKEFKVYENTISSLYEACKPEILQGQFRPLVSVVQYLRGVVESQIGEADVDAVKLKIGELLDISVVAAHGSDLVSEQRPEYRAIRDGKVMNLSKIDFDQIKEKYKATEYKNIEIVNLRDFIQKKLDAMLQDNSTRTDFAEKLQDIINKYNSGSAANEDYFADLVAYAQSLQTEEERHIKEGLTPDELELFDVLKKENLTKAEEVKVKNAARHLLKRLVEEQPKVLVQDWFKDRQSQIKVQVAIETVLNDDLPDSYEKDVFKSKSGKLFDLVFEYASRGMKWAA